MDSDILRTLDEEIRELLTLVHEIKIELACENDCKEKIDKALFLSQQIFADLYHLRDEHE
ncbi:protein D-63 [Sulfolobus sp. E11-6]|uniref:protein D-63 n=1 Tax=Sulfolobus sp. E11-6 TaxID=2663020 RepID=UPI00129681F0|nr:protein D-63 [Sulfolobus sp. E11-6]QGA69579.1 protein D-63 [Sulfolobus sp. E11-6]QGA69600.1 protein D-63 [Sulfolobus sp. E11-6]QGA87217.1 hypothetical protein [Sulfolobus spindle-shaped virus SSV19]